MHELSIALSIVDLAEKQARQHNAKKIKEIELEIGSLAGVELHTLMFALESSVKGTMLENAKIVRNDIQGEGRCGDCDSVFEMTRYIEPCPKCGSFFINIIKGKELRVKSVVVE